MFTHITTASLKASSANRADDPCLNNIITGMKETLNREETLLAAWKAVRRIRSKDGSDFKDMASNFEGAKYKKTRHGFHYWENELVVSALSENNDFIGDGICGYICTKYITKESPWYDALQSKPQNIIQDADNTYYVLDVDDLFTEIGRWISKLEKRVNMLKEQINALEPAYNDFHRAITQAVAKLGDATQRSVDGRAFRLIRDTVYANVD